MPDWRRLVGRRLGPLAVAPERRDEIVRELAAFLEDRYEERLRLGAKPRAALRDALMSAGRWPDVAREIERVEGLVTRRLKTLWLPGLGVSVVAMALLLAVARAGTGVQVFWQPPEPPVFFYWPWLLTLPLLGAAGAAWSRRQGGGRVERLFVALFPALALLAVMCVGPLVLAASGRVPGELTAWVAVVTVLNWVMLPALALLLGGLPLLHRTGPPARTA